MKEEIAPVIIVKPSFEELTSQINTRGNWIESVEDTLKKYFVEQEIYDENLLQELSKVQWKANMPCNQ